MNGFGVGLPLEAQSEGILHHTRVLDMLRPNWWHNWQDLVPDDPLYVPTIRRVQRANLSDQYVLGQRDRERYWFAGNEPERADQDDTTPAEFVKGLGGWTANVGYRVAIPGVQINDRGMAWLDECLRLLRAPGHPKLSGKMRWHIHIYANNGDDWMRQWIRFLKWMQTNKCGRPVVVSETASISSETGNQLDVMTAAFNAMRKFEPLIGVGWFSAHYSTFRREYERTDLFDKKGKLKVLGEWFRTFAERKA